MFLLRLDDASEYWDKEKWYRIHNILIKYNIKPIIAIIPKNEDEKLLVYPKDNIYNDTIKQWINEGWEPALHGYNHVYYTKSGGINPVNYRSEFAGVEYSIQSEKIKKGYEILKNNGIYPKIFVAKAHTFDKNTLKAIKKVTDIRIISDTIASDYYYKDEFWFIPVQSNNVRKLNFNLVTFCYHPNNMKEKDFANLENFIKNNQEKFISFNDLQLGNRKLSFYDKLLSLMYFIKIKIFLFKDNTK